ncbi:MAG: aldo/keto reductase [Planctomycetota bacterium]
MEYSRLGKTDLEVSRLGFGASSLGAVFRDIDEDDAQRTVHRAIDLGINFIDVAPYYGLTKAESALGRALRAIPRDRYYLATKVGRYGDEEFDFSAERVTQSVDESLERLGLEEIDLIQCHDIEFVNLDQIVDETLPALEELKRRGKVRFLGITGLPLKAFREVLKRSGDRWDTVLSYCRYSLNDTSLADLIPELKELDLGIISASPLSMGLLTRRGPPDWHPAPKPVIDACRRAAEYCDERGVDIAQLALQFSLGERDIASTLVGTASSANLERNCAWIEASPDPEILAAVQDILQPVRDLTWPSGLPENADELTSRNDLP